MAWREETPFTKWVREENEKGKVSIQNMLDTRGHEAMERERLLDHWSNGDPVRREHAIKVSAQLNESFNNNLEEKLFPAHEGKPYPVDSKLPPVMVHEDGKTCNMCKEEVPKGTKSFSVLCLELDQYDLDSEEELRENLCLDCIDRIHNFAHREDL